MVSGVLVTIGLSSVGRSPPDTTGHQDTGATPSLLVSLRWHPKQQSRRRLLWAETDDTIELEKVTYQRQGFVGEIATGFYGVIWTVTHPGKTLLRGFGIVGRH
jgi:hypothetical protein